MQNFVPFITEEKCQKSLFQNPLGYMTGNPSRLKYDGSDPGEDLSPLHVAIDGVILFYILWEEYEREFLTAEGDNSPDHFQCWFLPHEDTVLVYRDGEDIFEENPIV